MSIHDVNTGLGGLDGSIRFELDRAENVGIGMVNTLLNFTSFVSPVISMADTIALGTTFAFAGCGAPYLIPFRGGRIDALSAGPPGVPEPTQSLRVGIRWVELRGLIFLMFDSEEEGDFGSFTGVIKAPQPYNQSVATRYLDGTTQNPLAVSKNESFRSDGSIFASDGNVTMKRLSESKQTFDETCKNLIERMINTVPKNVTLTDVILPIQNKVGLSEFSASTDPKEDDLVFTITLRTIDLPDDPNRTVTFFWTDRRASDSSSSCHHQVACTLPQPPPNSLSPPPHSLIKAYPS
ncbi:hypothetical protein D9758_013389 [Tetrapyrgos nigripes]|uniref:Peroxidase n=1 Tax=Tetrapyrgos nigripes TaxID=182062 RepID=A0A8H5FNV4_9AGAR|nr:hypothetical protein D9758_013389 [Tetrapyrgos nigripes]